MANNIFEQFDEAYSRWSILDKVGKEMQLAGLWQQTSAAYNYLFQVYQSRGYLTPRETNYANQISQTLKALHSQKMNDYQMQGFRIVRVHHPAPYKSFP